MDLYYHYKAVQNDMYFVIGGLNMLSSICCCLVMALFIRMIRKIITATQVDVSGKSENKMASEL